MLAFIQEKDSSLCCGCGACVSTCAHQALSLVVNEEGYKEPVLDESACIGCGLCDSVCPMMNAENIIITPGSTYAVINKDVEVLRNSSSGGAFSVFASYVLDNNGVVYGAAFDGDMKLKHVRVDNPMGLEHLRGSKYLQSDTEDVFKQVKDDLKRGAQVLFSGVPCQVAALRLFLRHDYANLLTTDIVCHGVPSQKMFNVFLNLFCQRKRAKIINYKFRDKTVNGWSCSSSSSYRLNGETKVYETLFDKTLNAYMKAFLSGTIDRKSCYNCPFARNERVGDITLADYWGVKRFHPEIDTRQGVSMLIANTDKGRECFELVSGNFRLYPSKIEWASFENPNLNHPTPYPVNRETVFTRAFASPQSFVEQYEDKLHSFKTVKFATKKFVKSTPCLYSLLRRLNNMFHKNKK